MKLKPIHVMLIGVLITLSTILFITISDYAWISPCVTGFLIMVLSIYMNLRDRTLTITLRNKRNR